MPTTTRQRQQDLTTRTPPPSRAAQLKGRLRRRGRAAKGTPQSGLGATRAMGWTPGAAHGANLVRLLILAALICGPFGMYAFLTHDSSTPPAAVAAPVASTTPGETAEVGNFAAEFVTAWLTTPAGQEASLAFYVADSAALRLPQNPATVQNVAVAGIERTGAYRAQNPATVQNVAVAGIERTGAYRAQDNPSQTSATQSTDAQESTDSSGSSGPAASADAVDSAPAGSDAATGAAVSSEVMVAWQVTVAADVAEPGAEGAVVMVRRYFTVPVLQQPAHLEAAGVPNSSTASDPGASASPTSDAGATSGPTEPDAAPAAAASQTEVRLRALTLPQPAAGPRSGDGADLAYSEQVSTAGALAVSAGEFLSAYVAGQGDISRYLSPGVQIQAIAPAAYAGVKVDQVYARPGDTVTDDPDEGQRADVLVSVSLTSLSQQQVGTQYALELTARAGRWEVSALQPVPALELAAVPDQTAAPEATGGTGTDSSLSSAGSSGTASDAAPSSPSSGTAGADPSTSTAAGQ